MLSAIIKFCTTKNLFKNVIFYFSFSVVNETAGVASALVGRLFATSYMQLNILYSAELFPTLLRSTGVSIAGMASRIGSILSPFNILLGNLR